MAACAVAPPKGVSGRARLWLLALVLFACCGTLLAQSDGELTEDRIKAAFLFKFGGYIDWPVDAFEHDDSPFVIGILGAETVAADLSGMVAERNINGRKVEIRRLRSGESAAGVQVLFVGKAETGSLSAILADVAAQPVLIVTETEEASAGGAINFVVVNNKVRFDVMLASAESRNLKISARLLGVARTVVNGSS